MAPWNLAPSPPNGGVTSPARGSSNLPTSRLATGEGGSGSDGGPTDDGSPGLVTVQAHRFLGPHAIVDGWVGASLESAEARPRDAHFLLVCRSGSGRLVVGPEVLKISAARSAALLCPGSHGHVDMMDAEVPVIIVFDGHALERELATLTGANATEPLRFSPQVDLRENGELGVLRLVDLIITWFGSGQRVLGSSPVLGRLVDALATALLLGQPHNHSHRLLGQDADRDPRPLRLAEAYMDAHLSESITVPNIARAAGVSLRNLQALFLHHRGCSPKTFLQQKRLGHARELLGKAPPDATVTQIAFACGFSHLGRFSIEYKKHFAESPSETLQKGKRRSAQDEG